MKAFTPVWLVSDWSPPLDCTRRYKSESLGGDETHLEIKEIKLEDRLLQRRKLLRSYIMPGYVCSCNIILSCDLVR